jgi:hypothetical protein
LFSGAAAQNASTLEGASIEERKNELNGRTFIVLVKDGQEIDTIKSTVAGASVESYYIESDTIVSFIINASFMRTYWRYRLFDDIWRHVDLAYVPSFIPKGVPNVSFNKSGDRRIRFNPNESFEIVKDSIIILTSDEHPNGKVFDLEQLRKHFRDFCIKNGINTDYLQKYKYKDQ